MWRPCGCLMVCAAVVALLGTNLAGGTPYWVDYEASSGLLPEDTGQGWQRVWGDWQGQYHGTGANRTLESGTLRYDSLYDAGVYDFSRLHRPGQTDPGPGEQFVAEWHLGVWQVAGRADPTVGVCSDGAWAVGFEFGYDRIHSVFENYAVIPFNAGVSHNYRLISANMREYDLYIDSQLVRQGTFRHLVVSSEISWGDGVQGAASLHSWDYLRFGVVVPEPSSFLVLAVLGACRVCGRIRSEHR